MIKDVIILCLDKRRELWEDLTIQCKNKGWNVHKFIVGDGSDDGLDYNLVDIINVNPEWMWGTGIGALRHYNAFRSHKAIMKYAIRKQLDRFLLMEDDCCFTSRFDYLYPKVIDDLSAQQWDLAYLGWHSFEYNGDKAIGYNIEIERLWNEKNFYQIMPIDFNVGGFHGVIINNSCYNTLLSLPPIAPMDCQCNQLKFLDRLLITPKILHVNSTWSYCEDKFVLREVL